MPISLRDWNIAKLVVYWARGFISGAGRRKGEVYELRADHCIRDREIAEGPELSDGFSDFTNENSSVRRNWRLGG